MGAGMARRRGRPRATAERRLEPNRDRCWSCGGVLWVAYHSRRRLTFLDEVVQFTLVIRRCRTPSCARYQRAYRPEEEGALALPHGEVGLDVTVVGPALLGLHGARRGASRYSGQKDD